MTLIFHLISYDHDHYYIVWIWYEMVNRFTGKNIHQGKEQVTSFLLAFSCFPKTQSVVPIPGWESRRVWSGLWSRTYLARASPNHKAMPLSLCIRGHSTNTQTHQRENLCKSFFSTAEGYLATGSGDWKEFKSCSCPLCAIVQYLAIPHNTTCVHTLPHNTSQYLAIREECKSCPKCTSIYCHLPPATPFSTN